MTGPVSGSYTLHRGDRIISYGVNGGIMVTNATHTLTPEDLMPRPEPDNRQWCPRQARPLRWEGDRNWILVRHDHRSRHYLQDVHAPLKDSKGRAIRFTYVGAVTRARKLNQALPQIPEGTVRGSGYDRTAPELPVKQLLPGVAKTRKGLEKLTKEQLIDVIEKMCHDWQMLNLIHNNRAIMSGWCGQYEVNQYRYNSSFKVFKLASRTKICGDQQLTNERGHGRGTPGL